MSKEFEDAAYDAWLDSLDLVERLQELLPLAGTPAEQRDVSRLIKQAHNIEADLCDMTPPPQKAPAQGIEARSDETPLGGSALLGESPVGKADAP